MSRPSRPGVRRPRTAWVLFLAIWGLSSCAFSGEPQQVGFTEFRTLRPGDEVSQTFVPRGEPISRFDVLVATFEIEDPEGVLTVAVTGGGEERVQQVAGAGIADASWLAVPFPPIDDAAGERFEATLRWEGEVPIAVFVNRHDPYPDGELEPGPGDLAFRVGHFGRLRGAVDAGLRVVDEVGDRLASDIGFTLAWLVVLAAGGATLLLLPLHRQEEPPPPDPDPAEPRRTDHYA